MNGFKSLLVAGSLAFASSQALALAITPTNDGEALANALIGSGISITPGSINYIGADGQAGFFTGGTASNVRLGIEEGILLTTGSALNAEGPNSSGALGSILGTPGDSDLDELVEDPTFDANVLEFEFVSTGGNLFFDYVFGSEEYNEYVNEGFNDVFAFLVDGVNLATIGGEPVSIDTVNCGNSTDPTGSNCDQYNDNDSFPFLDLEYDGFTNVFTASILGLSPGAHTIKLAIADSGDQRLDSGVFLKANSFTDNPNPPNEVPEPITLGLMAAALAGLGLRRRRS